MAAVLKDTDPLAIARRSILEPSGLDLARLEQLLAGMHSHALDEAELYFQLARDESWAL